MSALTAYFNIVLEVLVKAISQDKEDWKQRSQQLLSADDLTSYIQNPKELMLKTVGTNEFSKIGRYISIYKNQFYFYTCSEQPENLENNLVHNRSKKKKHKN